MNLKDIEKLAQLSRIKLSDKEKELFLKEIDSILAYVGEIKEGVRVRGIGDSEEKPILRNVMRKDENLNETGENTETLLSSAPKRKGNYLKVKKIME